MLRKKSRGWQFCYATLYIGELCTGHQILVHNICMEKVDSYFCKFIFINFSKTDIWWSVYWIPGTVDDKSKNPWNKKMLTAAKWIFLKVHRPFNSTVEPRFSESQPSRKPCLSRGRISFYKAKTCNLAVNLAKAEKFSVTENSAKVRFYCTSFGTFLFQKLVNYLTNCESLENTWKLLK